MAGESCTMLSDFFADSDQFYGGVTSPDDIFGILEALDGGVSDEFGAAPTPTLVGVHEDATTLGSQKSINSTTALLGVLNDQGINGDNQAEGAMVASPKSKKRKVASSSDDGVNSDCGGMQHNKMSHITVERNRRKQMNEHLTVLRSLMPCFYVKRGDQASIIGGVVDYISELQQVLQSLEAKKQRKVYSEVLSPRFNVSSPRPNNLPISPRKPPISPRLPSSLPISPRTPQPSSPAAYRPPRLHHPTTAGYLSPSKTAATTTTTATQLPVLDPSPSSSSTNSSNINDAVNELVANSKSTIADVEVKFSGPNLLLKTLSPRLPGQATRIISALEELSLEILHANISTNDETMINSFTLKIGIECQLSAEELAHHIQQTFC